jgi:cytochrome c-type biogenesis protein CcmH/NrfG
MSPGLPNPDADPRASLEAIEAQLRALPPPNVPAGLAGKLISGIPPVVAGTAASTVAVKLWAFAVGILAVGAVAVGLIVHRLNADKPAMPNANGEANPNAPGSNAAANPIAPALQKELQRWDEAIRNDPFDANAWFNLAKTQLQTRRKADAISSAQKALDIARSGRRPDLVAPLEGWLRANGK